MVLGTTASILLGLGALGAGVATSKIMSKGSGSAPSSPAPLPQPPSGVDAVAKAADLVKKKKASATKSVYTSPLGISGEADVARKGLKTKLGQ